MSEPALPPQEEPPPDAAVKRKRVYNGAGGGGYSVGRKTRFDNMLYGASAEIQFETWDLSRTKPGSWLLAWLLNTHNIKVSPCTLYKFLKRYGDEREWDIQRDRTRDAVKRLVTDKFIDGRDAGTVDAIESMMMATALSNNDPAAYVALQKLKLEREKIALEKEKVELNKRKLDQLERLEGVAADATLTSEQKGDLLKEVLS